MSAAVTATFCAMALAGWLSLVLWAVRTAKHIDRVTDDEGGE